MENLKIRKRSFVFTCRVDVRTMATLAKFMEKIKEPVVSRSNIGRIGLEFFAEIVVKNYPELNVESPEEAVRILDKFKIQRGERSIKPLMKHLQDQSLEEFKNSSNFESNSKGIVDEKLIKEAQEKLMARDQKLVQLEKEAFMKKI